MGPRARYWMRSLLWTLLVLCATELLLRFSVKSQSCTFTYDSDFGTRTLGGSQVRWGIEGFGVTRYSSPGEIETPYAGGTPVLVLGDSHTESFQVGSDANFVSAAERLLRQGGRKVDLKNLGDSGLDLADYVHQIPLLRKIWNPAGLVIQLTTSDFIGPGPESSNRLAFPEGAPFELLHRAPPNLDSPAWRVKRSLALLDYGSQRFREIQLRLTSGEAAPVSKPVDEEEWRRSVGRQLRALHSTVQGLPTLLLFFPYEPYLQKGALIRRIPEYRILIEEARKLDHWSILDPFPEFERMFLDGAPPRGFMNSSPPGTGHLNSAGHDRIGRLLAEQLGRMLP